MPTQLVAFRHRIGEAGMELILKESIRVNDPSDDKLYKKIIKNVGKIADSEGIALRQSYKRTFKKLGYLQRFKHTKNGAKPVALSKQ